MKIRATSYTFDASAKTVDAAAFTSLEAIQIITNVTDGVIIYNFADATKGGSLTGTTLTLTYDTTSMSDTDKLQILIEDGSATEAVSGTVTANLGTLNGAATSAKQDTGNTSLSSIDGKITAVNTGAVVVSSSALPTGAATSAKQDTGNASVASIDTKTPALGQALAAGSVPVILPSATITTLTPPAAITGFATSAKQDTGNTSLSSIDGKITAVNTGAVVVSSSALPTGAATSANQSTVITNTGNTATNTSTIAGAVKAEDSAHTTGDLGLVLLAKRTDTAASSADTTGDYATFNQDNTGRLWVNVGAVTASSQPLPTGASTLAEQQTQTTALQLIDDQIFADDAAYTLSTSKGGIVSGVAVETDGTDPTTVSAEGDAAAVRTDRQRVLLVNPTPPRHWNVSADYATAQTNTSIQAAPGAGLKLYITDITISNGATAGNITLLDGSGGTVKYEIYPAINGGAVDNRRTPIVLTANTALCITSTTVTTHSVNISGYIAP